MAIFVRNHCPLGVILSLQVTGVISPWSSKSRSGKFLSLMNRM
jgi:hypothetical protein